MILVILTITLVFGTRTCSMGIRGNGIIGSHMSGICSCSVELNWQSINCSIGQLVYRLTGQLINRASGLLLLESCSKADTSLLCNYWKGSPWRLNMFARAWLGWLWNELIAATEKRRARDKCQESSKARMRRHSSFLSQLIAPEQ